MAIDTKDYLKKIAIYYFNPMFSFQKTGCLGQSKLDTFFCAWVHNRKAKSPGLGEEPCADVLRDKAPQ